MRVLPGETIGDRGKGDGSRGTRAAFWRTGQPSREAPWTDAGCGHRRALAGLRTCERVGRVHGCTGRISSARCFPDRGGPVHSCGVRFRSPLRGSSGVAPAFPLSVPRPDGLPGADTNAAVVYGSMGELCQLRQKEVGSKRVGGIRNCLEMLFGNLGLTQLTVFINFYDLLIRRGKKIHSP